MGALNKLTLVPYLQKWDHANRILSIRLLVAPTGNPLAPLASSPLGVPAFADAHLAFTVSVSDSVIALPQRTLVDQMATLPDPGSHPPTIHHPNSRTIFEAIKEALKIPDDPSAITFVAPSRDPNRQLHKYLPHSYRKAFPFTQPRTSLAVIDDTYHCLMRCPRPPFTPKPPTVIGWGEALAFAMRRPRLAEDLGLIIPLEVPLDPAPRLENGGWLWVDLAATSDYAAQTSLPDFVRVFATRVPGLPRNDIRSVFTPVLFPVSQDATDAAGQGNFDKVFVESIRFDDGFSKIVHVRQPLSADLLDEEGTGAPIAQDAGVQLAWDDEDILEGQNRSLGAPPEGEDSVIAPRGVFGYRVDVRPEGGSDWTSLSKVISPCSMGIDLGEEIEERWCEVTPTDHDGQVWLPPWFATWRGGSLVVSSNDEQRLMNVPPGPKVTDTPIEADKLDLRYGRRYEFRVRLADTTGGGPDIDAAPFREGEAPIAALHMKRHRKPSVLQIEQVKVDSKGVTPSIRFWRPRLGYPEAVFAAGNSVRAKLLAQIATNDAGALAEAVYPGISDPDAIYLLVRVLVRAPTFDPAADQDGFVTWYQTSRLFPDVAEQPLDLELSWKDAADYLEIDISHQLGAEGTVDGSLDLITSRDVRLEVRAAGRNDMGYFANPDARLGAVQVIDFHAIAEPDFDTNALANLPETDALRSVFLRPDPIGQRAEVFAVMVQNDPTPALLGRLASAVDLVADGSLLVGQEGQRLAFGCAGITYHAAPDGTSIELCEPGELAGQWINVVQAVLDRDWTWRGAGSPSLKVQRRIRLLGATGVIPEVKDVGAIELMPTINNQATRKPDRSFTRMVLIDAFKPPLGLDGLPYEVELTYDLSLALESGGKATQHITSCLPIVTPPAQVPRVVAAGLALTKYDHDREYARTASRTKRLWLEFAEPLADSRDAYFVRPLNATPDPMLLPGVEPAADPYVIEGTPLDPELVRVITPRQVQDLAGLSTMQRLEPASNSDRRFLVPLPPNTDPLSPELFSFYTYEIRVGHDRGPVDDPLWTTAQGRFGEPLVLEGMQHPAPELACSAIAEPNGAIRVRAPYATPYAGLRRVISNPPNTQIWVVLYARVTQADASTKRNIQITMKVLHPVYLKEEEEMKSISLFLSGEAHWSGDEILDVLESAGLPFDCPITALAVELLPEPNSSFSDPLGGDLGQVRILRTSPLVSVERSCCMP